ASVNIQWSVAKRPTFSSENTGLFPTDHGLPIRSQQFASPRSDGVPPGFAAHAWGQRPDAAVDEADLNAASVSRRGPGRIAVALLGLDLKSRRVGALEIAE